MSTEAALADALYDEWIMRWRRPVAVGDVVLVHGGTDQGPGYNDLLFAVDLRGGWIRWSTGGRLARFDLLSAPAVNGPVAVVGRTGGHLLGLGLGDGGERWRLAMDVRIPLPHTVGAQVAVVDGMGWLLLIDPLNGRATRPLKVAAGPAALLTLNGRLVVVEPTGGIRVYEPGGATPRWGIADAALLGVDTSADTVMALAGADLLCLSGADGSRLWSSPVEAGLPPTRLAVGAGLVAVADAGAVRALRSSDGAEAWRAELPGMGLGSIAADRGVVAADADDGVHLLRAHDGKGLWHVELPRERHGALGLAGGEVVSPRTDGYARTACLCTGGRQLPRWIAEIGASGLT